MDRIRIAGLRIVVTGMVVCVTACAVNPPGVVATKDIGDRYRSLYAITHEDMSKPPLPPKSSVPSDAGSGATPAPPTPAPPADPPSAPAQPQLLSAPDYARTGYTLALERCNTFFDLVTKASNETQMTKSDIAALGTAAAAVIALVHRSSKPVGITAAVFGLSAVGFDNYQKYALLTAYPTQTRDLVKAAMKAYRDNSPPGDASDIIEADARVSGYAQLCTYSGIVALAGQAISNASPQAVGGTPSTSSIFTAADQLAKIKDIQSQLQLPNTTLSDQTLAQLALLADSGTSASDRAKIATLLPTEVAAKAWDGTNLTAMLTASAADLTALTTANSDFKQLIAKVKTTVAAMPAPAAHRPGDALPPLPPAAPVTEKRKEWQPPIISIGGSH